LGGGAVFHDNPVVVVGVLNDDDGPLVERAAVTAA
jgi:hypothetical protein